MNEVFKKFLIFTIISLFQTGCATVPLMPKEYDVEAERMQPRYGMANIYVVRELTITGSAWVFEVLINGKVFGAIAPGTYFLFEVPPGTHSVSTISRENSDSVNINAIEGENYFVEIKPQLGMIASRVKAELIDEDRGRQLVIDGNRAKQFFSENPTNSIQTQEAVSCKMSDLNIDADIPEDFKQSVTECPKVAYSKLLTPGHSLDFFIHETWYPYLEEKSMSENIDGYVAVVQHSFNEKFKGQTYTTRPFNEESEYPPAILKHGGGCRGLEAILPLNYNGYEGVEWRKGIMCLVELPRKDSHKWSLIQVFFCEKYLDPKSLKPVEEFEQFARSIFRSIRTKE